MTDQKSWAEECYEYQQRIRKLEAEVERLVDLLKQVVSEDAPFADTLDEIHTALGDYKHVPGETVARYKLTPVEPPEEERDE